MSASVDILQLQQFVWECVYDSTRREEAVSAAASFLVALVNGLATPLLIALILFLLAALLYRPRIPRGGLWLPAFGLFGGTPKFYTHTRPASFCGLFGKRRHRVTTHRRRKG